MTGGPAAGSALIVRQGLLAWLRASSGSVEAFSQVEALNQVPESWPAEQPAADEVVRILVNLILNRQQEVRS